MKTTADLTEAANNRLVAYGSLCPGRENHHLLQGLSGTWSSVWVRGKLQNAGWAAGSGYPGIVLDPEADEVSAYLFESPDLPAHWDRLDAFEGSDYERHIATVRRGTETLDANIYALRAQVVPPR